MAEPSTSKLRADLAYSQGVQRTIPTDYGTPISVSNVAATASLAAYKGKWIWIRARTLDVTVLRKPGAAVVANQGFVLKSSDDEFKEFWVDPGGEMALSHIASGSATIEILYDAE